MQRVGILLAGCGAQDGSDIHEVVLAALALERARARVVYLAPTGSQVDVVDHSTGCADEAAPARDIFIESARLARGVVTAFDTDACGDLSALVVAGGLGMLKNLFDDVLVPGRRARLKAGPADILSALMERRAPLGATGLAHFVLEALVGELGFDPLAAPRDRAIVDPRRRIGWAPGFLTAGGVDEAARGIDQLIAGLLALAPPPLRGRAGSRGES